MGYLIPPEQAVCGSWPGFRAISPSLYLGRWSVDPHAAFLQLVGSSLCLEAFVVVFSGSPDHILEAVLSCAVFSPGVAVRSRKRKVCDKVVSGTAEVYTAPQ